MNQYRRPVLLLAAFASFLTASSARAADAFTWNPRAVRLDGERFTADTLVLGDYARITFGFDGRDTTFLDRGFMPILGFTLQGELVQPAGFGAGWGAYIDYEARGTQTFSDGVPVSATFTQLSYSIVGYNGAATFALDGASGAPTVGGVRSGVVTLGSGSLIDGALSFLPGRTGLTIKGAATNTITDVPPQFSSDQFTGLDVNFVHPPDEYMFLPSQGAISIPGNGSSSSATIRTRKGEEGAIVEGGSSVTASSIIAVDVPEPTAALLVGTGLFGLGLLRRRPRRLA